VLERKSGKWENAELRNTTISDFGNTCNIRVKQPPYRPGVAQRVPGS